MSFNKEELIQKVNEAITELRPFLEADGGDMEFVELTDEGVVKVRLLGACSDCSMSLMTLKAGLEEAVKKIAPEINLDYEEMENFEQSPFAIFYKCNNFRSTGGRHSVKELLRVGWLLCQHISQEE